MTRSVSRRWFGCQLGAAIAGTVAATGSAQSLPAPDSITVAGSVRWNNRARGILSFQSDGSDPIDLLIYYSPVDVGKQGFSDDVLRKMLRPGAAVVVQLEDRLRQGGGIRVSKLICAGGRPIPVLDRATVKTNWLVG